MCVGCVGVRGEFVGVGICGMRVCVQCLCDGGVGGWDVCIHVLSCT